MFHTNSFVTKRIQPSETFTTTILSERVSVAVTTQICVRWVLGWNLNWDNGPDFHGFFSVLPRKI
jgi:hypothetical protein